MQLPFYDLKASYVISFNITATDAHGNVLKTSGSFMVFLQDSPHEEAELQEKCKANNSTCLVPVPGCVTCIGDSCDECPTPGEKGWEVHCLRRVQRAM